MKDNAINETMKQNYNQYENIKQIKTTSNTHNQIHKNITKTTNNTTHEIN